MGTGDFFGNLKHKVRSLYNNFFYDGQEAPAPANLREEAPAADQAFAAQDYQQGQQYQQPYAQQPLQYAAPAYNPYQQQPAAEANEPQMRNRRMAQHAPQHASNVVDFGSYQQAYQQNNQPASFQNASYQQNANTASQTGFQQSQTAYQAPSATQEAQQPSASSVLGARIINARGMGDCRTAITLLRNGDAVVIVMENVTDPAEMRRLVDTLSGACYSLTATITKVSRYGVYLLAPQTMAVYADQTTNQMNGAPGHAQPRNYQPAYTAGRNAYQQPAPQQAPQQPRPMNYAAPQQGFTQRSAAPEEAAQPFYARTAPQEAQVPPFSAQPAGYGYAPDETEAVDQ